MEASLVLADLLVGIPQTFAPLVGLQVARFVVSYRSNTAGIQIEMATQAEAAEAARRLQLSPWDCRSHGFRSYQGFLTNGAGDTVGVIAIAWVVVGESELEAHELTLSNEDLNRLLGGNE